MSNDWATGFERKVLFRIARFVAFTICFLLFLGLVGGAIYFATTTGSSVEKPDPAKVVESLKPTDVGQQAAAEAVSAAASSEPRGLLDGLKLPPALQEIMAIPGNIGFLRSGLDQLPEDQRQDCLDGMATAVTFAQKNGVEPSETIESYLSRCQAYAAERVVTDAAAKVQRLFIAGGLLAVLILIALFSLVLVLMAIERNTRPGLDAGRSA